MLLHLISEARIMSDPSYDAPLKLTEFTRGGTDNVP